MSDDRGTPDPLTYEARLEAVLESISDAFYALDSDWRYVVFNRAAEDYFGVPRDVIIGRCIWDIFPGGRGTAFEAACNSAMHEGKVSSFETPSLLRPERTVELRILPMRDGGVAVAINDVTERRRAEDALKAALGRSEEILESIPDAFYALDDQWRFTYVNKVAEAWWSQSRDGLLGKVIWDEFPQAVPGPFHDGHLTAAAERRVVRVESISPTAGRWVDVAIFPSGAGLSVYFRDITERKQAEERQRLLVNELNHRVKNALATVQSIAAQSLKGADVSAEARERFTARLLALAKANDVLVAREWSGATLQAIAEQVASPHAGAGEHGRFAICGPAVELAPKAAMAVALALHELATNAAKYGALSTAQGRVELSWAVEGEEIRLTWRETGGPPPAKPARTGFGTRLIQKGLATELKATVSLDYAPTGLVCVVTAPLSAVVA
jgi:PAS domain S-box-containing protein